MEKQRQSENLIVKLTFEFALLIITFSEKLDLDRHYVISKQLQKSGTAIGEMVWEAQNAESKADFIHKMKIAAKEGDETEYWLLLCKHSWKYSVCDELLEKLEVINKVLNKIISSAKN